MKWDEKNSDTTEGASDSHPALPLCLWRACLSLSVLDRLPPVLSLSVSIPPLAVFEVLPLQVQNAVSWESRVEEGRGNTPQQLQRASLGLWEGGVIFSPAGAHLNTGVKDGGEGQTEGARPVVGAVTHPCRRLLNRIVRCRHLIAWPRQWKRFNGANGQKVLAFDPHLRPGFLFE